MVIEHLPSLTGRHTAQEFKVGMTDQHYRHSSIWKMIIKDEEEWTSAATKRGLNPVLIGDGLHGLFNDPKQPAYLALVTGDNSGDIRYEKAKLLSSLRAYDWSGPGEIVFRESNITLNIGEALWCPEFVSLVPEKLFSCQDTGLRSASLYWKDNEYALRTIGADDIVGIGERVSNLQDISHICGITLTHPKEMELGGRWQQRFEHPIRPKVYPFQDSEYYITRWERDDYRGM
jgi:hypothetical protein